MWLLFLTDILSRCCWHIVTTEQKQSRKKFILRDLSRFKICFIAAEFYIVFTARKFSEQWACMYVNTYAYVRLWSMQAKVWIDWFFFIYKFCVMFVCWIRHIVNKFFGMKMLKTVEFLRNIFSSSPSEVKHSLREFCCCLVYHRLDLIQNFKKHMFNHNQLHTFYIIAQPDSLYFVMRIDSKPYAIRIKLRQCCSSLCFCKQFYETLIIHKVIEDELYWRRANYLKFKVNKTEFKKLLLISYFFIFCCLPLYPHFHLASSIGFPLKWNLQIPGISLKTCQS